MSKGRNLHGEKRKTGSKGIKDIGKYEQNFRIRVQEPAETYFYEATS
jgi:hypothetical protein